ncbi:MAG: glycosyltransferase family 4 protein [Pseudomonadota bacterium]|nr:glycosyltransferase family 4 protein [Pseudomonadota bacterium]
MKIAVSVHGRFHGFDLARELNARDALAGLLTTYPNFIVRKHVGLVKTLATAPTLELQRRICQRLGNICGDVDGQISAAFGAFAARNLPDCNLLVGWSSATLEAICPAHDIGARVVIERGSSHILHQTSILSKLHAKNNRSFKGTSARTIERELAEYDKADLIAVPSSYAAKTFAAHGIPRKKIFVNPYGVDLKKFTPNSVPKFVGPYANILFVGQVGLRKGIPELLSAFSGLKANANLTLVGPLERGLPKPIQKDVRVMGPIPMPALPDYYREADIFCLPSWEEGFPLVLLQAMACGLPVVATEETGAGDIITSGVDGELVPAGDVLALREALDRLVSNPELAATMGAAARERVSNGFDWKSYGGRALDAYKKLISGSM